MWEKYLFQGKEVEGTEVVFETEREGFNTYILEDGTKLKFKSVVTKVIRLNKFNPDGSPLYMLQSSNIVAADCPPHLKKKSAQ